MFALHGSRNYVLLLKSKKSRVVIIILPVFKCFLLQKLTPGFTRSLSSIKIVVPIFSKRFCMAEHTYINTA